MRRIRWQFGMIVALTLTGGCAHLEARKVPLDKRLTDTDQHYKGFRYYLPRPYIVVSQRVCVGSHLITGKLMQGTSGALYMETVNEVGQATYRDLRGVDQTMAAKVESALSYVYYDGAAAGQGAPAIKSPGTAPPGTPNAPLGTPFGAPGLKPPVAPKPAEKKDSKDVAGTVLEVAPPVAPRFLPLADVPAVPVVSAAQLALRLADTAKPGGGSPVSDGAAPAPFQFITLPDFEEQMAVRDVNFAAKGKYQMKFADGWQLRSVGGSWDATEVAVKALQVLGDAVKAAGAVRAEQLNKLPVATRRMADITGLGRPQVLVVLVQATYLEPGVYKLLKSSEQHEAAPGEVPLDGTCALISELGLPLVTDHQFYLLQP
jgi:hypothetical protein